MRIVDKKSRNEFWLVGICWLALIVMQLTMLFFNKLFFLGFFGVVNDVFVYLLIALGVNFIKNLRVRRAIYSLVLAIFGFLLVIDATYSAFFSGFTSIDSLFTMNNLFVKSDIGVSLPLAAFVLLVEFATAVFFVWFIKIEERAEKPKLRYLIAVFLSIALSVTSVNTAVISHVRARDYDSKLEYYASSSFLYDNFYNSYRYASTYGYINYRVRDLTFSGDSDVLLDDITAYFADSAAEYQTDYTALFNGKNLINVLCETFDTRVVTRELMPNFVAAMERSLIFDNYYVPTFFEAATINTEYMSMTGMLPISAKSWASSMGDQYKNNYFKDYSLAGQMAAGGYSTYYAHLGYENFYSRKNFMPNLGFKTTLFVENLDYNSDFNDTEIIDLLDGINYDESFYASVLTYSMHTGSDGNYATNNPNNPNYSNYKFVRQNYPDASREMQIYMTKAKCFDDFVGLLFDKLQQKGVLDNTAVLFYPDHYAYGYKNISKELGADENSKEIHHQFLTMCLPDDMKQSLLQYVQTVPYKDLKTAVKTDLLGSTIDLTPTLANLFLKEANHKYFAGKDIFAGDNYVFFSDYTIFDGEVFLDLEGNLYSHTQTNQEKIKAKQPKLAQELENYVELTLLNKIMLDVDYFASLSDAKGDRG